MAAPWSISLSEEAAIADSVIIENKIVNFKKKDLFYFLTFDVK